MAKRIFSREFKLAAVRRLAAGEKVHVVARELGVQAQNLYRWLERFDKGGAAALRPDGRPTDLERVAMRSGEAAGPGTSAKPSADPLDALEQARMRIVELERKVGGQELELDFFQRALRHVEEARSSSGASVATRSTRSSK